MFQIETNKKANSFVELKHCLGRQPQLTTIKLNQKQNDFLIYLFLTHRFTAHNLLNTTTSRTGMISQCPCLCNNVLLYNVNIHHRACSKIWGKFQLKFKHCEISFCCTFINFSLIIFKISGYLYLSNFNVLSASKPLKKPN